MEEEDVVYVKVFDEKKGDIVFEGKVSTDFEPGDLKYLGCFRERGLTSFFNKRTEERAKSFKGSQELIARSGYLYDFVGVLYVAAGDGVLRKSKSVPSCECVMLSLWELWNDECEKAFKCETLEELDVSRCQLGQIPSQIGKLKKLKKLRLLGLDDFKSIPEEIVELTSLEELWIEYCGIESLSKMLKELKLLKSVYFGFLPKLHLRDDDLVLFSKLKQLKITDCATVFISSFANAFWEMIKMSVELCCLVLHWDDQEQYREIVAAALEENGSIVDGGSHSGYEEIFKRNKKNHERARQSVVCTMAVRRWRGMLNGFPKEMVKMIAMMLWNTKCDVEAWSEK